jgi:hypothetical protein
MPLHSFVNVPVPTAIFLSLVEFLRKNGSSEDPVEIVNRAIEYWMENASWKQEDLLPDVSDRQKGYRWKQVLLPHGSLVRMKYKGQFHYAKIEGDSFKYDNADMSPSEFAHAVTGTSRNAWRDLEIKRPTDQIWILADILRNQTSTGRSELDLSGLDAADSKADLNPRYIGWREIVEKALRNLGGKAHLSRLYDEAHKVCVAEGKSIPKAFQQTIQGTLEVNSSDSDNYRGSRDIFYMAEGKGSGVWALRSN